ncbi:unnamed protein product, partial [Prunus brigantina]
SQSPLPQPQLPRPAPLSSSNPKVPKCTFIYTFQLTLFFSTTNLLTQTPQRRNQTPIKNPSFSFILDADTD